jgi:hypothetical protein
MKIKFLKTVLGAKDILGNSTFEYQENETYELPNELAKFFLNTNLVEELIESQEEKALDILENKAIDNLDNKAIKIKKIKSSE